MTPTATPALFRKKPVPVEAVQWDGTAEGAGPVIDWILSNGGTARFHEERPEIITAKGEHVQRHSPAHLRVDTREGPALAASEDDWILRGVRGEFYPCAGDIFAETYDPVTAVGGPLLVGFSGYARAGKNAAAEALLEDGWHHASFAAKLKAFLLAINPQIVQNQLTYRLKNLVVVYGWERAKDEFPEIRELLQRTGTDAGRTVLWGDVWVDAAFRALPEGRPVAFTDVRFANEAAAIRARGGLVIRVNRDGVGPAVGKDGKVHVSETALDDYDFDSVIANDGTLEDLHAKVRAVVQRATQA